MYMDNYGYIYMDTCIYIYAFIYHIISCQEKGAVARWKWNKWRETCEIWNAVKRDRGQSSAWLGYAQRAMDRATPGLCPGVAA